MVGASLDLLAGPRRFVRARTGMPFVVPAGTLIGLSDQPVGCRGKDTAMRRCVTLALAACLGVGWLFAQGPPNFKSQEEVDAFMKVQAAPGLQERADAAREFMASYPKSEAVGLAAYMAMLSYQQLNDFENMLLYGDMVLANNPEPGMMAGTLISLATAIPTRTREFDLDKEEKLSKAEDYAKKAMGVIPQLGKLDPNMSDDEWLATKMDFMSQCHEALGGVFAKREQYEQAEASFRKAVEMSQQPVPFTLFNLADVLSKLGKKEEAAAFADQCVAGGGVQAADGTDLCARLKAQL